MLFLVHMAVRLPLDVTEPDRLALLEQERTYSHELQRAGKWIGLWRVVGAWENYSVFDVDENDELHRILEDLPFFPYLSISVVPLSAHPSWIAGTEG